MAKGNGSVADKARALLEGPINSLGYDVWDVEYVKEGADWHLIITIDSPEGITIDDCEKVTRFIDPILDENDPVPDSYNLDVSSPGIERDLRTREHYDRCVGEKALIKLYKPLDGVKQYIGIILENENADTVIIDVYGDVKVIPFELIAKANTVFDFDFN